MTSLHWHTDQVCKIMSENGIKNRDHLAERLGLGTATVYRAFDKTWAGKVSLSVLTAIVLRLRIPPGRLIREPGK